MAEVAKTIFMTTYSICLPILLSWLIATRKERKTQNKFLSDSVESISKAVEGLTEKIETNEAMTSRYRIIRAADEIRNGNILSDDHIEQLGEDIDIYDSYCDSHPNYKNHKGQNSKKIVLDYEKKLNHKGDKP